ncbi:MAG: hypothetical protein AB1745_07780, partial [Pseudomonadota bacterium]
PAPFVVRRATRRLDFEQGRPLPKRGGPNRSQPCQNQIEGATPYKAENADLGRYLAPSAEHQDAGLEQFLEVAVG